MAKKDKDPKEIILRQEAAKQGLEWDALPPKERKRLIKDFEKQAIQQGFDPDNLSGTDVKKMSEAYRGQNKKDFFTETFKDFEPSKFTKDMIGDKVKKYDDQFTDFSENVVEGLQGILKGGVFSGFPGINNEKPEPKPKPILGKDDVNMIEDKNPIRLDERRREAIGDGGPKRSPDNNGGSNQPRREESSSINTRDEAEEFRSMILGDADLPTLSRTYDHLKNLEDKTKFNFDDTYAPDSQAYRDAPGYLLDAGRGILGAMGATEKLEAYTPSDDFQLMGQEAKNRRDLGLDQETKSLASNQMDRAYNYDVKNIRNMAGGSGGVALANLGGASDRYYKANNNLAAIDAQVKGQNRQDFYNAASAGESVNRQIWQDDRTIDMMNKQAGGALLSDSIDSLQHRKEYEDTYKKPGSPYYEYMKEMTLGTRQNRELMEFGEKNRMDTWEQMLLGDENQMQEEIHKRERARNTIIDEYKNQVKSAGGATTPETADEFNNYKGEPIMDMNSQVNESEMFKSLNKPTDFGLTRNEMANSSESDLKEKGIERVEKTGKRTNPDGTTTEYKYFDYNKTEEIPDSPDENLEMSDIQDAINNEYSQKEKALMDEWYLKDEKEYNKRLKALQAEKGKKIQTAKDEYKKK